jgi:hypothetical protein
VHFMYNDSSSSTEESTMSRNKRISDQDLEKYLDEVIQSRSVSDLLRFLYEEASRTPERDGERDASIFVYVETLLSSTKMHPIEDKQIERVVAAVVSIPDQTQRARMLLGYAHAFLEAWGKEVSAAIKIPMWPDEE